MGERTGPTAWYGRLSSGGPEMDVKTGLTSGGPEMGERTGPTPLCDGLSSGGPEMGNVMVLPPRCRLTSSGPELCERNGPIPPFVLLSHQKWS
jgi:hypothetical protein